MTPTDAVAAPRQTFTREERIARRADFTRVYEQGSKQFGRYAVVFILDTDRTISRLGITVTKKVGKAHQRNRFKRWVRECYRTHRPKLGVENRAVDLVINVKPSATAATHDEFCRDLVNTIRRSFTALPSTKAT